MTANQTKDTINGICGALDDLDLVNAGNMIRQTIQSCMDNPLSVVELSLKDAATRHRNAIYERRLRLSRLEGAVDLSNLLTYKVRQLDVEYIQNLGRLSFVRDRRNLVIWGNPGTGKTWLAQAFATEACRNGIKTRWVTYPFLCRELHRLAAEDPRRFEARMAYYSRFELLCIDEFPNSESADNGFMMQEFFNERSIRGFSNIIVGQSAPAAWDALFPVKSFGQSIRGRILRNAIELEMKGPDLRLYKPES
jgi:DNA replication protein DnaC